MACEQESKHNEKLPCLLCGFTIILAPCVVLMLWLTMDRAQFSHYLDAFLGSLKRNTAPLDWCEPNYAYTGFIAEFFNTISNILFFTFPPILMWLFHVSYARPLAAPSCHLVFILLMIIGMTSTYYHATLSLLGQLLDEISILWVLIMVFAIWTPFEYIPAIFKKNRSRWQITLFVIAILITCVSWILPAINAILLMFWGVPVTYIMTKETRRTRNSRAYMLGIRCLVIWFLAFGSWLTDRLHCDFWLKVGFPYMHAMWHLFVAITSYQACVLLCYYNALSEWGPDHQPAIRLWPSEDWVRLGVPYVVIEGRQKTTPLMPV